MLKERYQNPIVGDTINLRLFAFNSNNYSNIQSIQTVDIYYLDPQDQTPENPDGRRLVASVDGSTVTNTAAGTYALELNTDTSAYIIGKYLDVWTVYFSTLDQAQVSPEVIENDFNIWSNLWFTDIKPIVYDFNFNFQPNRIVQGSKKYLNIEVVPLVPQETDLKRYYTNLAITADMTISIETKCSDCMPTEEDLRLIVEDEPIEIREKNLGFYFLDTTDFDCGLYNVWFKLILGPNLYISDKNQLLIYK